MQLDTHMVFIRMTHTQKKWKKMLVKKILVDKNMSVDAKLKVEQLIYNALLSKVNS